ncbi:hypothetical protein H7170_03270 [Candidatus Gracilibacteria bacterium]|nr:hypothetical protein [Candidatus Gracilibacteria bacterium]
MADTPPQVPESSFLTGTPIALPSSVKEKTEETLYNDFFQENSTGEMSLGGKKERSSLEILVSILQYLTICIVVIGILFGLHVYIRSSSGGFLENYPFLCPYLHYDINAPSDEKACKSVVTIGREYVERQSILEENIIKGLTEYIPIKVSASILDASPEKKFIIDTYDSKPHVNEVLEAFGRVKLASQSVIGNIECSGLTVTNGNSLSIQCTIYGGGIGDADSNGQIGSARIQAMRFIENLADTSKSSLILENQPTSLGIEKIKNDTTVGFLTRTTLPIQVRYVPLIQKI